MAQLSTLLSLNTAPTSRSAAPKTSSPQSDKRPLETPDATENKASASTGANEQTPVKAEKSRFEKLLEEGKREQADAEPPADTNPKEPQSAPTQEAVFNALSLFGGNPLPPAGQSLPPAADMATSETIAAVVTTQPSEGLTATGLPSAAPASLFASSQALPTLFDLDGPDPSLFANSVLAGTPLSGAAMPTSASIFGDAAAGSLLAANDAMSPAALTQTQSTAEGAMVPGGLQSILSGTPGGTPSDTPRELSGAAVGDSSQVPGKEGANPALQSQVIGVAQPVPSVPGQDALTAAAQQDSAAVLAAQSASQSAALQTEAANALSNTPLLDTPLSDAAVMAAASAMLPEAAASEASTQTALPTTNGQAQAAEAAWQPDAAERARAWRGIGTLDPSSGLLQGAGQGLAATGRHEFSLNYTAVAGQGGQLQQFAESLRQAGGVVDTSSPSSLQTAAPSSNASSVSNAMQAADRGASLFNASSAGPELQQAWRSDSAAAGVTTPGGRAAAGTLSFAQGMQASTFGQPLGQSFGDSEWAESVTKRVALMAGQKVSSAQIELDPPELGAMTVRVSVTGDQANVMFTSAHAQVREALEQTFTRLQDMLGQQGLQLADAQVSDQSAARQQQGDGRGGQGGGGVFTEESEAGPVTMQSLKVPKGLVDYYA